MRIQWLSLTLIAASAVCFGQAADPCATQRNTIEINACGRQTLDEQERELDEALQALLVSLTARQEGDDRNHIEVRRRLMDAQGAWREFRDNDCRGKLALWGSGSIRGIKYLACMAERTEQRTKELRDWATP